MINIPPVFGHVGKSQLKCAHAQEIIIEAQDFLIFNFLTIFEPKRIRQKNKRKKIVL